MGLPIVESTASQLALHRGVKVDDVGSPVGYGGARWGARHRAAALAVSDLDLLRWYDEWIDAERDRFRQLRLHALEELAAQLIAAGLRRRSGSRRINRRQRGPNPLECH